MERLARLFGRTKGSVMRRGLALFASGRSSGPWGPADDEALRTAIGVHDPKVIAVVLGRSLTEVRRRLRTLRTERRDGAWTTAEIRNLRRLYGTRSPADLAVALARSPAEIEAKAVELCLGRDKAARVATDPPQRMPRWTVDEIKRLRQLYPRMDSLEVARMLGRSVASVRNKASQLGLGKSAAALTAMGRRNLANRQRTGPV